MEADLKNSESDNELLAVNAFLIRGSGRVDDIELHNTVQSAKAPKNCIGEWNFNEAYGLRVEDSSGEERHGTLVHMNATNPMINVWTMGRENKALQFGNVSNSYISIPNLNASFAKGLTFSAWVKYENVSDAYRAIGSGLTGGGPSGVYPRLFQYNGRIHFQSRINGSMVELIANENCILIGQWAHVAVVVNMNMKIITLYIDGVEKGVKTFTQTVLDTGSSPMYIGNDAAQGLNKAFNGCIDEVKLYNRPLSAAEIAYLAE